MYKCSFHNLQVFAVGFTISQNRNKENSKYMEIAKQARFVRFLHKIPKLTAEAFRIFFSFDYLNAFKNVSPNPLSCF